MRKNIIFGFGLLWLYSLAFAQSGATAQQKIEAHSRRAHAYLEQKRPDLAIPEFQAILSLDPNNADAQGNLGVLLFFRGDYAAAAPHLRSAVHLQPGLWKIQALLGLAEARVNDAANSRADLEAAFPHLDESKFKNEVGRVLIDEDTASGDLEKAAAVVSSLLAIQPTDPALLYMSYRINSDLAGKAMITLALAAPHSAEMHQVMARELARHGEETAAIANYREAIQIDPRLPGLHTELGDLLFNSQEENNRQAAEAEFKAALAVNPDDGRAELMLGEIAARRGDLQAAYEHEMRAAALQPNSSDACTELAKTLLLMNDRAKAQQWLERAIQLDPTDYVAHYRLNTLYRQQGNIQAANHELEEYKKYKDMKEKLRKIFHDMRVETGDNQQKEADLPE
ncbi:MAG: tetratricopeptide repeat protein [Acidobacterium ailaaui]|jgi:Tfp pilus assembly protein PilF|nr:tetratricopeptide repeat protein [Pseudacidobacterium ailaaui]